MQVLLVSRPPFTSARHFVEQSAHMEAKLIVVGGKANKRQISLKLPMVIGRSREAGLTVDHPMVSRRHCELSESNGLVLIRDLGSLNGTFVGAKQINEAPLRPADEFTVGPVTFRVEYKYAGEGTAVEGGSITPSEALEDTRIIDAGDPSLVPTEEPSPAMEVGDELPPSWGKPPVQDPSENNILDFLFDEQAAPAAEAERKTPAPVAAVAPAKPKTPAPVAAVAPAKPKPAPQVVVRDAPSRKRRLSFRSRRTSYRKSLRETLRSRNLDRSRRHRQYSHPSRSWKTTRSPTCPPLLPQRLLNLSPSRKRARKVSSWTFRRPIFPHGGMCRLPRRIARRRNRR